MTKLLEIQEKLQDTTAAIVELERTAIEHPQSSDIGLIRRSLEKRQSVLLSELSVEADSVGIDVCTYRIFGDRERQTLRALVQTLGDFQTMVSTVYDAVKSNIPKIRARISPEMIKETEFDFAYTFPGSVGVVLTIPNQRLLGIESYLDETFSEIANMAQAKESSEVLSLRRDLERRQYGLCIIGHFTMII